MESTGEESDQLPEQQESGGTGGKDDTSQNTRDEAEKNAGPGDEGGGGQATGNPAAAG